MMMQNDDDRVRALVDGELDGEAAREAEARLDEGGRRVLQAHRVLRRRLGALNQAELPRGFEARLHARLHGEAARRSAIHRVWDWFRLPLVVGTALCAGVAIMWLRPVTTGTSATGVAASSMVGVPSGATEITWRLRANDEHARKVLDVMTRAGVVVSTEMPAGGGVRVVETVADARDVRRAGDDVQGIIPVEMQGTLPRDGAVKLRVFFVSP